MVRLRAQAWPPETEFLDAETERQKSSLKPPVSDTACDPLDVNEVLET
jgi:hypothetical protein